MAEVPSEKKFFKFHVFSISILILVAVTTSEEISEKKTDKKTTRAIDLNDFGPDDLAKILKAQKEKDKDKDLNDLKNRFLAAVNSEPKTSSVVQQTEEHETQKEETENGTKKKTSSGFPDISSLFPNGLPANIPYVPPGEGISKPIQMMATTPDRTQLVCECYAANGVKPLQTNKFDQGYPSTSQQPILPFFSPIGGHFARKPKIFSHKKPKVNPIEAFLMGFIKKPKRKPPTYFAPPNPGFFYPNQIPDYNSGSGEYGSTKGKPRTPQDPNLPPSPGTAIKGSSLSRRGSQTENKSKWHWYLDQYRDSERGFNLN